MERRLGPRGGAKRPGRGLLIPLIAPVEADLAHNKEVKQRPTTRSLSGNAPVTGELQEMRVIPNKAAQQDRVMIPANLWMPADSVILQILLSGPRVSGDCCE